VRQGHYAYEQQAIAKYPPADVTLERIGEFVGFDVRAQL